MTDFFTHQTLTAYLANSLWVYGARHLLIFVVIYSDGMVVYRNEIAVPMEGLCHLISVNVPANVRGAVTDLRVAVSMGGPRRKKIPKRIFICETTQTPYSRKINVECLWRHL